MKMKDLEVNSMYYSKRFGCYGMCVGTARYFAHMLFPRDNSKAFNGWFHCQELEKTHIKKT